MTIRPVVGVTSSRGNGRFMWWFHWISLRLQGARPVRLVAPLGPADIEAFDGLVIGGGDDIGTEIYQGAPALDARIDPQRDAMELALLEHHTDANTPILGVCRGAQMLNVFYGGNLHQDMHHAYADVPRMWTPLPRKRVHFRADTFISRLMGVDQVVVNSLHRQAIDRLGGGLAITGRDEYGVVQSIEDPRAAFRIGVQWHPEFLVYRSLHRRLFEGFVDAARQHALARSD
ncbi:MAG: gamma-glutamyl-gamma-aminobutyrate hydrolase family protein [Gammaproteobacteria bacterium]|nr:gamma-glutamyl-gamma-aminobutyrate hydrolase family protein [Gammaproteobacteria bacterium]